jgi:hypothetical protein
VGGATGYSTAVSLLVDQLGDAACQEGDGRRVKMRVKACRSRRPRSPAVFWVTLPSALHPAYDVFTAGLGGAICQ